MERKFGAIFMLGLAKNWMTASTMPDAGNTKEYGKECQISNQI